MKKFDFSHSEMSAMLVSLIGRRNNILSLRQITSASEVLTQSYADELATVEGLLEKFFPGSLERIRANDA